MLSVDGVDVGLRLDYATLLEMEEAFECGVLALSAQLSQGRLGMKSMVEMVAICAVPGLSREGLGEKLMACGVSRLAKALADMLCEALAGQGEALDFHAAGMRGQMESFMERFPDMPAY